MKKFLLFTAFCSFPVFSGENYPLKNTYWLAEESIISIRECDARLCGVMEHIFTEEGEDPFTILDTNNPEEGLRTRPLIGIKLLDSFDPLPKKGIYRDGLIYDPRSGKSYKGKLSLIDEFTLKVEGCIAFLCQGVQWDALEVKISKDGSRSATLLRDKDKNNANS
ncbi:MAG: DUF2147 domain-containing protein [Candidatus Nanopelagicales bacterium]